MNPMKFYRLTSRAVLPQKGTQDAAGFDLFTMSRYMLYAGQRVVIPTGIAAAIHPGWYGRIAPRSGLAAKHGIDVLAGVVDADYRGEIKVILLNTSNYEFEIGKETAIAQLIIERIWDGPVEFITDKQKIIDDDLEFATERGTKGFGSTDNIEEYIYITCPKCHREWNVDSEQGICAEFYQKCFACSANELTKAQTYIIAEVAKERGAMLPQKEEEITDHADPDHFTNDGSCQ